MITPAKIMPLKKVSEGGYGRFTAVLKDTWLEAMAGNSSTHKKTESCISLSCFITFSSRDMFILIRGTVQCLNATNGSNACYLPLRSRCWRFLSDVIDLGSWLISLLFAIKWTKYSSSPMLSGISFNALWDMSSSRRQTSLDSSSGI